MLRFPTATSLAAPLLVALCSAPTLAQAGFPTYAGILADMNAAATNYPSICQFVDLTALYGTPPTHGGNHQYALKISDNVGLEEDEPSFMMVSGHHGNEYGTPIVALDAIARLTQNYGTDPVITALVNDNEIWIAPCWNPDGYSNSRTNGIGVDLNRNYPFLWATSCNNGIRGASPGSEPETQTMMAWSEDQRFTKVLDFHSSGRESLFGYVPSCGQHVLGSFLQAEATVLSQNSGYGGQTRGPSANGEHYQWQLGNFSNMAFLTEISTTQSPTRASADAEAATVWPGTVWMLQRAIPVWGRVTDVVTGQPLVANISYLTAPFTLGEQNRSEPRFGRYHAFLPAGAHVLRFELPGYVTQDIPVNVTATGSLQVDVALTPPGLAFSFPNGLPSTVDTGGGTRVRVDVAAAIRSPQPGTGTVTVQSANGTQTLAMTELSANTYEAELPGFVCGDTVQLSFAAEDTTGAPWTSIAQFVPSAVQVAILSTETFEVASGWVGGQPGDTATTGQWGRTDPLPTAAQPGDDHTVNGTQCFVTDGRGGSLGTYDVDNGFTTLMSPLMDLSATPDASIRYWRWFSNNQGSATDDVFRVDLSDDNGATWHSVEIIAVNSPEAGGGWFEHSFKVSDIATASSQVRLRFIAEDINTGSIVEAAVDDVEIFVSSCDGEVVRGGVGCPDSTGAVLRLTQAGSVHLGATVRLGVESGAGLPTFLILGFDDVVWNGNPLPLVLPGTGAPGCVLSIQPDVTEALIPFGGTHAVAVPNTPSLVGTEVFWQALMIDPALATTLTIATSDHIVTTVGS